MLIQMSLCTQVRLKSGNFDQNKGQGLLEYGLIIFLVVIGIIVAASLFGEEVRTLYINILDQLAIWLS